MEIENLLGLFRRAMLADAFGDLHDRFAVGFICLYGQQQRLGLIRENKISWHS